MYLTIQGIVLRVTDYNDKDALLTMLTRRHGRLTVKAPRASCFPTGSSRCLNTGDSTPSTKPSPSSCLRPCAGI